MTGELHFTFNLTLNSHVAGAHRLDTCPETSAWVVFPHLSHGVESESSTAHVTGVQTDVSHGSRVSPNVPATWGAQRSQWSHFHLE